MKTKNTKILFITLSNFGDVILTLPVLDALREHFPQNEITVMVGPRAKEIFEKNLYIHNLIIYDKHAPLLEKIKLFFHLCKQHFDVVIDLRNTLYGALLPAGYKTSPFLRVPASISHMKERNLYRLRTALRLRSLMIESAPNKSFYISQEYTSQILEKQGISPRDKFIIIAPAARGISRRWDKDNFVQVCRDLTREYKVILIGAQTDKPLTQYIKENCPQNVFDFAGLTNITQLAHLLSVAVLVIACDTGILHLASYMDAPILALFGPSNEEKYGPWSQKVNIVLSKEIFCRPCEVAKCRFKTTDCMRLIRPDNVIAQAHRILSGKLDTEPVTLPNVKRVLIVRTDRIGDVLLSTPVIKALRYYCPGAYIAIMVRPYAADIVIGNPYLDEVIIYDKDAIHNSWQESMKFALELRKKKFDLALILHPTNRVHLITFFAGITRRVGYNRKNGFLLTDALTHNKELGEKHELEYSLDLVRHLGLEPKDKKPYMPIREESEKWISELFAKSGIREKDKLVAISPGASDPTRSWPQERFAQVADKLSEQYGFTVVLVGGPKDADLTTKVRMTMRRFALDLGGKTSVSQLASALKRCSLFIGLDSGPMHMACALGLPVVALFGRKQKGLSPVRWGPIGVKHKVIHKDVGCNVCRAHECTKDFACFKEISVDDVLRCVDAVLKM